MIIIVIIIYQVNITVCLLCIWVKSMYIVVLLINTNHYCAVFWSLTKVV